MNRIISLRYFSRSGSISRGSDARTVIAIRVFCHDDLSLQRLAPNTERCQPLIGQVTGQLARSTHGVGVTAASKIGFPLGCRVQLRPKSVNLGVVLGVGSQ
jgi:hypothetical protein